MSVMYGLCAVVGGTVLVIQFVMTLMGISGMDDVDLPHGGDVGFDADAPHDLAGGDHHSGDADHPGHSSNWLFSVITFRTLVAALAFFGLGGLASESSGFSPPTTLAIALMLGGSALFGVHYVMRGFHNLSADGTFRIDQTIGKVGNVYLRIPAQNAGTGKVTVSVNGREEEFSAVTSGDLIPTGAKVVVVALAGAGTLEVQPASVVETQTAG